MNEPSDPRATTPLQVKAPVGSDVVEISWADGHQTVIPNRVLRGYCPCAGCQGHSGDIRFFDGRNAVIDAIEEVGSYALGFTWGDGHASGIYTFRYLRRLCACDRCWPNSPMSRREALPRAGT